MCETKIQQVQLIALNIRYRIAPSCTLLCIVLPHRSSYHFLSSSHEITVGCHRRSVSDYAIHIWVESISRIGDSDLHVHQLIAVVGTNDVVNAVAGDGDLCLNPHVVFGRDDEDAKVLL